MYCVSSMEDALRQGEILANVVQYIYDPTTEETSGDIHEYVVIASQDCDLQRAFESSTSEDSPINGILLFPASPVEVGRKAAKLNSTIWSYTKNNGHERYHVLEKIVAKFDLNGAGIPDLLIDFRSFFTLSYYQLQCQIQAGEAQRRCVLTPPYREHFQSRLASYLARVPLDPPHEIGATDATPLLPAPEPPTTAPDTVG